MSRDSIAGSYAYTFASTSGNSLASLCTNIIHLYNASSVFCLSFKFYKPYHGLFGVYHSDTELMEMTRLWSERNSSTYWRMGKLNITSASDFIVNILVSWSFPPNNNDSMIICTDQYISFLTKKDTLSNVLKIETTVPYRRQIQFHIKMEEMWNLNC